MVCDSLFEGVVCTKLWMCKRSVPYSKIIKGVILTQVSIFLLFQMFVTVRIQNTMISSFYLHLLIHN